MESRLLTDIGFSPIAKSKQNPGRYLSRWPGFCKIGLYHLSYRYQSTELSIALGTGNTSYGVDNQTHAIEKCTAKTVA